ncbi:unnamed protein product [Aphanomyces euteiches]|uniref:Uncharacterized protein n=1 Tax=Aphanomyces euteiches TaxID=100861 RepID=A0A6G0WW92_9STRA|nr:hypothetical protein Ae201684_011113 [Aphanomyces euteiches]KAH9058573.1 hypothetical protein Ae201684P_005916 [Aphanomyces euteiches]KAH9136127.1 hypothetical protein AeRB84_018595 [Aphanomyces euteiches]
MSDPVQRMANLTLTTEDARVVMEKAVQLVETIASGEADLLCELIATCLARGSVAGQEEWSQAEVYLEDALAIAKYKHESASQTSDAVVTLFNVKTVVPQAKALDLVFQVSELVVHGKNVNVSIPYTNIKRILKLPKYAPGGDLAVNEFLFVVILKSSMAHRKDRLSNISFVLAESTTPSEANVVVHRTLPSHDFADK